jgi:hypothetical protein
MVSGSLWRGIALARKHLAVGSSRCVVRRKSTVWRGLIDRALEVALVPAYADAGLVYPPADVYWALAALEGRFDLGTVLQNPTVDG